MMEARVLLVDYIELVFALWRHRLINTRRCIVYLQKLVREIGHTPAASSLELDEALRERTLAVVDAVSKSWRQRAEQELDDLATLLNDNSNNNNNNNV